MNVAGIIAQCRRIAKVDTSQYSDANALIDLNSLKNEFWSKISSRKKKLNWQQWKSNSVALQSEYTLAEITSTTEGTKLLESISINYNGETYDDIGTLKYIPVRKVEKTELEKDWDYYVENQSELDPIFFKSDKSYFIAPAPRTAITNGIKLTGIRNIPDYTLSTSEADIMLPVDIIQALTYGLVVHGLENKGADDGIINNAEARRQMKRDEALDSVINDLDEGCWTNEYPE